MRAGAEEGRRGQLGISPLASNLSVGWTGGKGQDPSGREQGDQVTLCTGHSCLAASALSCRTLCSSGTRMCRLPAWETLFTP